MQAQVDLHRAAWPVLRVRLQAVVDQILQHRRRLGAKLGQLLVADVGQRPSKRLVDDEGGAVEVGTGIDRVAGELLGRHVARRAHDGAGLRQCFTVTGFIAAVDAGDAKVEHAHMQPDAALVE